MKLLLAILGSFIFIASPAILGEDEFWRKFFAAYQNNDAEGMKKQVIIDPQGAIDSLLSRADRLSGEIDEETTKQVEAMRQAWSDAFHNQFFDKEYKYLSMISPATKKQRNELLFQWKRLNAAFNQTKGKVQDSDWADLEKSLPALSDAFESIGDTYNAAWARYVAAQSFDQGFRPKGHNNKVALDHYRKFLELREQIDLKDGFYNQVKTIVERLEKLYQASGGAGGATPSKGNEKPAESVPFKEGSDWVKVSLTPAPAEMSNEVEHFGYDYDDLFTTWTKVQTVNMKAALFPNFSSKVYLAQEGPSKFSIDQDGDEKGDVKFKAVGKPEFVEITRSLADGKDTYAFCITSGSSQEIVQKVETNIAPTKDLGTFFFRSAAVRAGEILGTPFHFFDDNSDGRFNYERIERTMEGLKKPLPVIDSWILGKEKKVAPASAFALVGDKWFRFDLDNKSFGKEMRIREVEVKEATLQLQYKGPASMKPTFFIVRAVGSYEGGYFDIGSGKPVKVPSGGYEIFYGLMRSGKGKQVIKTAILKGSSKTYITEPGKTTTIQIGEPFSFDFEPTVEKGKLLLSGNTVSVVGSAGEHYELIWDEVPTPEVQARAGGKPLGKAIDTKRAAQADLNKNSDWAVLWHPMDVAIELPPKGAEKPEMKLFQKHKWFGKIESPWK